MLRFTLAPIGALTLLAGCQLGSFREAEQQKNLVAGVFRYPIVTNPTTLDPALVTDGDTIDLLQQVYEGLVAWDEKNEVVGMLAQSWSVDEAGTTYTFTLKDGVKFHNGKLLTSEDVKWSIERASQPKLKSPVAAAYMGDIVGLNEVVSGAATSIKGIRTPDPRTVVIQIDKPRPYWIGKFTYLASAILPKDGVPADREISKPAEMIGTGPFRVTEYVPEQIIKLEAFGDYHGGAPKLARLERPVVKDAVTRLSMYRTGEVDLVMLERADVPGLQKDAKLKDHLKFFDRPAVWYLGLNQTKYPPFRDVRVRRAIAMALDKEEIVNEILGGINKLANGIIPPGVKGHREQANVIERDVEGAKRLLSEAGFPGGKGLPPLELWFREGRPDIEAVAVAVERQLRENLGIQVKLTKKEWRAYLEARDRFELPMFHMRWAADYLDPENFISFFLNSKGAENKTGYANEEVDRLTNRADTMPDGAERLALYAQAEDIGLQDAAMIPIYFQRDAELINPRVKGLRESIFGHLPHTTVVIE